MTIHELKCWPSEFEAMRAGLKTFEVRSSADRDFAVGDELYLKEWNPSGVVGAGQYTGRTLSVAVAYILHGGRFGLPPGLCVMAVRPAVSPMEDC